MAIPKLPSMKMPSASVQLGDIKQAAKSAIPANTAAPAKGGYISNIVKDIKSSVDGFVATFSQKIAEKAASQYYPKGSAYPNVSDVEPALWNKVLPYSFKVVTKAGEDYDNFSEFTLNINPTSLSQDENFSINLIATQGGVVAEHAGIIFRDLVIAGTTGVHPYRGAGGVNNYGTVILGDPKVESGYTQFQHLRNYFIAYAEAKKNAGGNNPPWLIFINRKENLNLVVEPMKFSLRRAAGRSTLFDYSITCRALGRFRKFSEADKTWDAKFEDTINSGLDFLNSARGAVLKTRDLAERVERGISGTLLEYARNATLFLKGLSQTVVAINDMPSTIWNNVSRGTVQNFYDTVDSFKDVGASLKRTGEIINTGVNWALKATGISNKIDENNSVMGISADSILKPSDQHHIATALQNASVLPRQYFEDAITKMREVRDNAADLFGLGDTAYDAYAGRTPTLTPAPGKQTTNEEIDFLKAIDDMDKVFSGILSSEKLFKDTMDSRIAWEQQQFNNDLILLSPGSVNTIILPNNATLEDLAVQYLGDAKRWPEIVIVNRLKPPYIDNNSTDPYIKKSGDRILIPSAVRSQGTKLPYVKQYPINERLTETEKNLGIDLKLSPDFDIVLTNANDFDLVAGGENAGQAIVIKTQIERGSLKYHPTIGVGFQIGEKTLTINDLYDELKDSLLQDDRFENITDLQARVEGNVVYLRINVKVRELADPVPLTLVV